MRFPGFIGVRKFHDISRVPLRKQRSNEIIRYKVYHPGYKSSLKKFQSGRNLEERVERAVSEIQKLEGKTIKT